jgi:hypothetical protein
MGLGLVRLLPVCMAAAASFLRSSGWTGGQAHSAPSVGPIPPSTATSSDTKQATEIPYVGTAAAPFWVRFRQSPYGDLDQGPSQGCRRAGGVGRDARPVRPLSRRPRPFARPLERPSPRRPALPQNDHGPDASRLHLEPGQGGRPRRRQPRRLSRRGLPLCPSPHPFDRSRAGPR